MEELLQKLKFQKLNSMVPRWRLTEKIEVWTVIRCNVENMQSTASYVTYLFSPLKIAFIMACWLKALDPIIIWESELRTDRVHAADGNEKCESHFLMFV